VFVGFKCVTESLYGLLAMYGWGGEEGMKEEVKETVTIAKVSDHVDIDCGQLLEDGELRGVIGMSKTGDHCSNEGSYLVEMSPYSIYVCGIHLCLWYPSQSWEQHLENWLENLIR